MNAIRSLNCDCFFNVSKLLVCLFQIPTISGVLDSPDTLCSLVSLRILSPLLLADDNGGLSMVVRYDRCFQLLTISVIFIYIISQQVVSHSSALKISSYRRR